MKNKKNTCKVTISDMGTKRSMAASKNNSF